MDKTSHLFSPNTGDVLWCSGKLQELRLRQFARKKTIQVVVFWDLTQSWVRCDQTTIRRLAWGGSAPALSRDPTGGRHRVLCDVLDPHSPIHLLCWQIDDVTFMKKCMMVARGKARERCYHAPNSPKVIPKAMPCASAASRAVLCHHGHCSSFIIPKH